MSILRGPNELEATWCSGLSQKTRLREMPSTYTHVAKFGTSTTIIARNDVPLTVLQRQLKLDSRYEVDNDVAIPSSGS
jgi:hypothetical protein